MAHVYNKVGSMKAIKHELQRNNINEFNNIKDLNDFRSQFENIRRELLSDHSNKIMLEKADLKEKIAALEHQIEIKKNEFSNQLKAELEQLKQHLNLLGTPQSSYLKDIIQFIKKWSTQRKINDLESHFDALLSIKVQQLTDELNSKKNRYLFIDLHLNESINQSCRSELVELERKRRVIDGLQSLIYGAIGELKVSMELENLPEDFILINDFTCTFKPAIFNKFEKDYIKSVQIDHLLISRAGLFLIETKNWSLQSLQKLDLRSPVKQILRTNYALNKLVHEQIDGLVDKHHWGDRKIPIRNLIVLINNKPDEVFQHVKILTLVELCGYVESFGPTISEVEKQRLVKFLNHRNEAKE